MKTKAIVTVSALLLLLPSPPASVAQRSGGGELQRLRREVQELKEGQKALMEQLLELKELLSANRAEPAASKKYVLSTDGMPFKGEATARLVLIEFSDYQCPFCAQHARETFPKLDRDYVKTGKLKYVFGDLPLEEIHPDAMRAAKAAACASEQGKYWEMHAQLFKSQNALGQGELSLHAQALGLEVLPFQRCLFSDKHEARIRRAKEVAASVGVSGTPTFIIGLAGPDGSKVEVLKVLVGIQSYASFQGVLDQLIAAGE
jgi:protein-disulfide isomerase